jgi:hypothetical protein
MRVGVIFAGIVGIASVNEGAKVWVILNARLSHRSLMKTNSHANLVTQYSPSKYELTK